MPYKLIITAGPSLDEETHQIVHVNSETSVPLSSDNFSGQVTVRVAHFRGLAPHGTEPIPNSPYFEKECNATFSIDASGVYKTQSLTADDLLFGIVFRTSITDRLPSTYKLGVRALQWFNPNIDFQLEGEKPTVLAPLLALVSRVNVTALSPESESELSTIPTRPENSHPDSLSPSGPGIPEKSWFSFGPSLDPRRARHKFYSNEDVRRETIIGSNNILSIDMNNGFLDFRDLSLRIPGMPFNVGLGPYMNGRPVQYCCMSRDKTKVYWCVVFTLMEDEG
ncbi:hypothetical protein BS47DRAFT_1297238 [Hydnum rufescens UP504]|uniref:Domain of unknown function at the cortex 1 domain-containing protein n=1 Tax=Hydnum rufescens UP504 TaxID=1448309 RepID=A0A9P6AVW4_9AGAM|nr:hypothetical protein BS47DRAFT_1297238 [Hydnum rufescens UP504]